MPRSNWKGAISFGLVSIPVSLFNSENTSEKASFHQIDKKNKARIEYKRINAKTGQEVDWKDIIKGYVYDKETIIPVQEGELQKVAGENARTIAIECFVKKDSIDMVQINKTYYLIPEKKAEKGYFILREALEKSGVVGIAKVILSTKEYLAAVSCYKNALVLYLLHYQENLHDVSDFNIPSADSKKYKVNTKEINAASLLIKAMTEKWDPSQYKDEYQAVVHKWAEHKIQHKAPVIMAKRTKIAESKGTHVNFIDLLKRSMKNSKKSKPKNLSHLAKKKSPARKGTTVH